MLTDKQEKFVQGLIKGLSQREAYKQAFNVKKMKDETIDVRASELFKSGKVKARYNEIHDKLIAESERETIMSAVEILEELSVIGRSKISDFLEVKDMEFNIGYDENGEPIKQKMRVVEIFETKKIDQNKIKVVSEIKRTKDGIALKLHDKIRALETLAKYHGLDRPKEDTVSEVVQIVDDL